MHWNCPHCGHAQTVVPQKRRSAFQQITIGGLAEGVVAVRWEMVGCSNAECRKLSAAVALSTLKAVGREFQLGDDIANTNVILQPRGSAKPQPDYIPAPLREDYVEACLIKDLSPKAAATLVRRCIQGMIREFTGIQRGTLYDEIKALRTALDEGNAPAGVTHESLDAIDAVRSVGNIGAHMERDINIIVDVEPGEAQKLIELAEMLFEEWYVARHNRQERLANIKAMALGKQAARHPLKDPPAPMGKPTDDEKATV